MINNELSFKKKLTGNQFEKTRTGDKLSKLSCIVECIVSQNYLSMTKGATGKGAWPPNFMLDLLLAPLEFNRTEKCVFPRTKILGYPLAPQSQKLALTMLLAES